MGGNGSKGCKCRAVVLSSMLLSVLRNWESLSKQYKLVFGIQTGIHIGANLTQKAELDEQRSQSASAGTQGLACGKGAASWGDPTE